MDDLARFCCLNPDCRLFGQRDAGNLYVRAHYGSQHWRLLCCRACGSRFSERKGTALFGSKLPMDKSLSVLEHLHEGCGMRQTARLTRVNRSTVGRLAQLAGDHASALHDELVAFSPADARGAVRREVDVRRQEGGTLQRAGRPARRLPRR
jgi:LacI family transcriptional regulator